MLCCDLCGRPVACLQKEIDKKQFDICERCWSALVERLGHKERVKTAVDALVEQEEFEETLI